MRCQVINEDIDLFYSLENTYTTTFFSFQTGIVTESLDVDIL